VKTREPFRKLLSLLSSNAPMAVSPSVVEGGSEEEVEVDEVEVLVLDVAGEVDEVEVEVLVLDVAGEVVVLRGGPDEVAKRTIVATDGTPSESTRKSM
jgi:hypothetical protein